jgi:hypothetical protein
MVSGWFFMGVGELFEEKTRPAFAAISSKRMVLATGAAKSTQAIAVRPGKRAFIAWWNQFISQGAAR